MLWFYHIVNPFKKIMALVVRIEPNNPQTLLIHDDVTHKHSEVGGLVFVQSFKGFNLEVAREFSKTFDGTRVKVKDVQFQVNEEFISQAIGLPKSEDKWFKT